MRPLFNSNIYKLFNLSSEICYSRQRLSSRLDVIQISHFTFASSSVTTTTNFNAPMSCATILRVGVALCLMFVTHAEFTISFQGSTDSPSANIGSTDNAANETVGFYNVLTPITQKSYFVGLRRSETNMNICYGVLISDVHVLTSGCPQKSKMSPKYGDVFRMSNEKQFAVIGSRYNAGSHEDGSETIKIKSYAEHGKYSSSGYRAFSIYTLEKASKLTPVKLPDTETINLALNTSLTTYGWTLVNEEYVITERVLQSA